jgi:hypothetical protein
MLCGSDRDCVQTQQKHIEGATQSLKQCQKQVQKQRIKSATKKQKTTETSSPRQKTQARCLKGQNGASKRQTGAFNHQN